MPSLNHSSKVSGAYSKQAGKLFQAQVMRIEKAPKPEHVIAVLLGMRIGSVRRHQEYPPETPCLYKNVALTASSQHRAH